jgi:putative MATE family efflux protein
MVAGAANAIDQIVDLFWAGFLGSGAIATIGVAQTWIQLFNTGRMGLDTGARAMVSRAVGSADLPLANRIALQCLIFNIGISTIVMGLGILLSDQLLRVLGIGEAMVEGGTNYQRLRFASSIFFAVNMLTSSLLQAGGDSFTPMKAQLSTRVAHIALSPVLMFGWLGFPELGISGAAVANGLAQMIGAAMNGTALFRGTSRLHLSFANNKGLDFDILLRQTKIGVPASVTSAERSLAQVVLVGLVAPFGSAALAVFSITQRLQMFGNLGAQGISQASGIIVGQNLGAGKPERARKTVWWSLSYIVAVQGVLSVLMYVFPEQTMSLFARDRDVMQVAVPWLHIGILGFMAFGMANNLVLALNTAGDTFVPMITALLSIWGIQQPIAHLLTGATQGWSLFGTSLAGPPAWNIGELGIAWAIVAAEGSRFLLLFLYFQLGPWWKKEVLRAATAPAPVARTP